MTAHSSTLAWEIPWKEEPGRLQSMGVAKSRARLNDFTFIFHFHALENEMAAHSSILEDSMDWRIPWSPWGNKESDTTFHLSYPSYKPHSVMIFFFMTICVL